MEIPRSEMSQTIDSDTHSMHFAEWNLPLLFAVWEASAE